MLVSIFEDSILVIKRMELCRPLDMPFRTLSPGKKDRHTIEDIRSIYRWDEHTRKVLTFFNIISNLAQIMYALLVSNSAQQRNIKTKKTVSPLG